MVNSLALTRPSLPQQEVTRAIHLPFPWIWWKSVGWFIGVWPGAAGHFGIQIRDVTADLADAEQIQQLNGVFVSFVNPAALRPMPASNPEMSSRALIKQVTNILSCRERVALPSEQTHYGYVYAQWTAHQHQQGYWKVLKARPLLPSVKLKLILMVLRLPTFNMKNFTSWISIMAYCWNHSPMAAGSGGLEKDFIIRFIDKLPIDNVADLTRILEYKRVGF